MTSCLYGFVKNGVYKLSYNNSDSHPDRFGKNFVRFLKSMSIAQMNERFDSMRVYQKSDRPSSKQIAELKSLGMRCEAWSDHPCWMDIEDMNGGYISYCDQVNFVCDYSSWLECRDYLYIVDLDSNTFIVYDYSSKKEHTQDWKSYYMATTFPLENIPVLWFNQLTADDGVITSK